jgi:Tol biopolymer transport system component
LTGRPKSKSGATWRPIISPDGKQVVYTSKQKSTSSIYLLDVKTKKSIMITNDELDHGHGSWSPDSKEIIYVQYGENSKSQLMIMSRDGQQQRSLLSSNNDITHPRWSPDGSKIAFVVRKKSHSTIVIYDTHTKHQQETIINAEKWSNVAWTNDSKGVIYRTKNETLNQFDLAGKTNTLISKIKNTYDPFVF